MEKLKLCRRSRASSILSGQSKIKNYLILLFCYLIILLFWQPVFAADYTSPLLKIFDSKKLTAIGQFLVFDKNFKGGGYAAVGDVVGDSEKEIIVGAGQGGSPQVRIFNRRGREIAPNFFAFSQDFKGGVSVATGNVDGSGRDEIIVGQAREGQAWVKVYRNNKFRSAQFVNPDRNDEMSPGKIGTQFVNPGGNDEMSETNFVILSNFLAYSESFEGGVNLASCDVNSDGKDEIITGPGAGGGPQIRIFDQNGRNLGLDFMAYEGDFRGGVSVGCGDVYGNKKPEIIVGPQSERKAEVKVYKIQSQISNLKSQKYKLNLKSLRILEIKKFTAFSDNFQDGVNLAAGDLDGNKKSEILVSVAGDGGPQVKVFNASGKLLNQFFAYDQNFKGGVRLAAGNLDSKKSDEIIVLPGITFIKKCKKNCVYLTFDDGYGAADSFPRILDILKARRVHATFFILGKAMQAYPDLMRRIVNEGHVLANHGYSHGYFPGMSEAQIKYEIEFTDQIMRSITGESTKPYFRYPYGAHDARTDAILNSMGYKYYHWTASTGDTGSGRSVQNSLWGALYGLHDGSIILAHTQSPHTAAALDQIITAIQNAGYNLATVEEMP